MKLLGKLIHIAFCTSISFIGSLKAEEKTIVKSDKETVREIWKRALIDDQRDYDRMISELRKVNSKNSESNEAFTAQFIIGRIELDRAETEALNSVAKAKEELEPLATKHPKTWQGQAARIVLIHIQQIDKHHREVISDAQKALIEIDWDLFGKNAPPDFLELWKMREEKSDLTRDLLRGMIVNSYLELEEKKEAENWIQKIEDKEMQQELQQQMKTPDK